MNPSFGQPNPQSSQAPSQPEVDPNKFHRADENFKRAPFILADDNGEIVRDGNDQPVVVSTEPPLVEEEIAPKRRGIKSILRSSLSSVRGMLRRRKEKQNKKAEDDVNTSPATEKADQDTPKRTSEENAERFGRDLEARERLAAFKDLIAEQDREIAERGRKIKEQDTVISNQDANMAALEIQVEKLTNQKASTEETLARVSNLLVKNSGCGGLDPLDVDNGKGDTSFVRGDNHGERTPSEVKDFSEKFDTTKTPLEIALEKNSRNERTGRLKKLFDDKLEAFDKLPTKTKVIISSGLVVAGLAGAMTGAGAVVAAVGAGQLVLRTAGALAMGRTAEKALKARLIKNNKEGRDTGSLKVSQERVLKATNAAVAVSAFLVGQFGSEIVRGAVGPVVDFIKGILPDEFFSNTPYTAQASGVVTTGHAPSVEAVQNGAPLSPPQVETPVSGHVSEGRAFNHFVTGNNLGGIISTSLTDMFPSEDIAKLTVKGKENLIENIIKQLTPEQLKEVGLSSRNESILKVGEAVDIKKLSYLAHGMTVSFEGRNVSLIERALKIQD